MFALWAVGQAILYTAKDQELILFVANLTYVFGLAIAWSFLIFAAEFPYRLALIPRVVAFGVLLSLISLILTYVPNQYRITQDVFITDSVPGFRINKVSFLTYAFTFFFLFIYSFVILILKCQSSTGETKAQLKHVIYSSLVPILAGSFFNLLFISMGIFKYQIYGPMFTLIFTITVSYLIFLRPKFK